MCHLCTHNVAAILFWGHPLNMAYTVSHDTYRTIQGREKGREEWGGGRRAGIASFSGFPRLQPALITCNMEKWALGFLLCDLPCYRETTALTLCISNKDETSANRGPHQTYSALISVLESTALNGCGIAYELSIVTKV